MGIFTGEPLLDFLGILIAVVVVIITYYNWKFTHWDRVGLFTLPPSIPFGNTKELFLGRQSFGQQFKTLYDALRKKEVKHAGIYFGASAYYFPVQPDLVKLVLQQDFQHFVNRGWYSNAENDPLTGNLLNLEDEKWKSMRGKLTPAFTLGKTKMMFETVSKCADELKDVIAKFADSRQAVDIKDIMGCFTTDIIGSCAFGLDCNSLKNPETEFRTYGKKVLDFSGLVRIKLLMQYFLPFKFLDLIKHKITNDEAEAFFMKVIKDTVDYREKNQIFRPDFMHLLIQLKNRGKVADDEKVTNDDGKISRENLTINELAAQAYVFFLAGFETSATTMTFALFELATNPDLQSKLRNEVQQVLKKHNGHLTYEAITEMTYMEKVVQETLRKYPPLAFLFRQCTKEYTIPESSITLKKGTNVIISVLGMHHDPDYYPNPEVFDPERFSEENKKKRTPFTWIPFGEGPRNCIGLRFGIMESKVGLATLINNFTITVDQKTKLPLVYDTTSVIVSARDGIWLNFSPLT